MHRGAGTSPLNPNSAFSAALFRELCGQKLEPQRALEKAAENREKIYGLLPDFQIPMIGWASRSLAVSGSRPKLSSIVRSTL